MKDLKSFHLPLKKKKKKRFFGADPRKNFGKGLFDMELRLSWDRGVPVRFLAEQTRRWDETRVVSRFERAVPHLLFSARAALGCLAAGALLW